MSSVNHASSLIPTLKKRRPQTVFFRLTSSVLRPLTRSPPSHQRRPCRPASPRVKTNLSDRVRTLSIGSFRRVLEIFRVIACPSSRATPTLNPHRPSSHSSSKPRTHQQTNGRNQTRETKVTGTYHDNSQDQYGIGEGDHLDRFMRRVEEQGETAESRGVRLVGISVCSGCTPD